MPATTVVPRLTGLDAAGTLFETKGFLVSENHIPSPGAEPPFTPPPLPVRIPAAPASAAALPAYPMQPPPQPTQSYPGAPPTYAPPGGLPPAQAAYAPYAAPTYPADAPRPTSGLAVAALICGIAGVVLFWALIPVLASIAAVITGHMALGQIKRDPGIGGRGLAIAGLILGYAVIALSAITLVGTIISFLFVGAFSLPFLFST